MDSKPGNEREFFGRCFSSSDFRLIQDLARDFSALSLTELASTLCELLDWKRLNGKLKYKEGRAVLERLQAEGLISLPAVRKTAPSRPRTIVVRSESDPRPPLTGTAGDYTPLLLRRIEGLELSSLWNQFIDRYHYLRFRVPFGANLRYLVQSERKPGESLACLLFSSPAWKMAPRDAWIGWSDQQRKRNLQYIVSNSRFLVLPWVSVRGLASKVLSLASRQLPDDWERLYGYRPLLLETLVDPARFRPRIAPPTGSGWARPRGAVAWTAIIRPRARQSRRSTSSPCAGMRGGGFASPSRRRQRPRTQRRSEACIPNSTARAGRPAPAGEARNC